MRSCLEHKAAENRVSPDNLSLSPTHPLFKNRHKLPAVFDFSLLFTSNLLMNSYPPPCCLIFPFIYQNMDVLIVMNNSHEPLGVFLSPPLLTHTLHFSALSSDLSVSPSLVSAHAAAISFRPNDSLEVINGNKERKLSDGS